MFSIMEKRILKETAFYVTFCLIVAGALILFRSNYDITIYNEAVNPHRNL